MCWLEKFHVKKNEAYMEGSHKEGQSQEVQVGIHKDSFNLICILFCETCNTHSRETAQGGMCTVLERKPCRLCVCVCVCHVCVCVCVCV